MPIGPRFIIAAMLTLSGVLIGAGGAVPARQVGAVLSAVAEKTQRDGKEVVRVDLVASDVSNLGAFAFVMKFDADKVSLADHPFEVGPFLAASGREVTCPEPTVDVGVLRYACVTLGSNPPLGSDGGGRLVSVYFSQRGGGKASFALSRAEMNTPQGLTIPVTLTSAEIAVTSDDGRDWRTPAAIATAAALVLIVVAALVYRRLRGSARRPGADSGLNDSPPSSGVPPT